MTQSDAERRRRFNALFAEYSSDIVAYCGWRAGSSDAQDAVAEVFLTAWRRLDRVPEGDAARVWLYATARRVIANQRRSTRRRAALQERLAHEATIAPVAPSAEETLVYEALHRLGPGSRSAALGGVGRAHAGADRVRRRLPDGDCARAAAPRAAAVPSGVRGAARPRGVDDRGFSKEDP